jgi:hypothetical protein
MNAVDPLLREKVTSAASSVMPHILSLASRLIRVPSANPPGVNYAQCIEILEECGLERRRVFVERASLRVAAFDGLVIDVGEIHHLRNLVTFEY